MADTKIPITCIEDVTCENCIYSFKDERFYTPQCRCVDAYEFAPKSFCSFGSWLCTGFIDEGVSVINLIDAYHWVANSQLPID